MASSIFTIRRRQGNLAVIRSVQDTTLIGEQQFRSSDLNPSLEHFNEFWDLMSVIQKHGYIRSSMSVIGRSAVGAWWTLVRHDEYGRNALESRRRRLYAFYSMKVRQWDNIKDFHSFAFKLLIASQYLRYFGQAAFQILRDEAGQPVGLDFLPGFVLPNVDRRGDFKDPAFIQYLSPNPRDTVEFSDPRDVVFIMNPDWKGRPSGGTDIESLTEWALPLDIYLQTAAREYMKNRNTPEVVYTLPSDITKEAFDQFVAEMTARHSGARNLGRNPIAVQGEFNVKELRPLPDSLPYQESRREAREEELAVAGVSGAKLGLTESMASANIRELRREFHETSLVPLFRLIEQAFYEQIHVREFGYDDWEFKFKSPDFLNAVERATVHMRYRQMGVYTPNDVRRQLGEQPRTDPGGDLYEDQKPGSSDIPNPQGSPPEGREPEPDAPSQVGEPTLDDQDPVRGDQHDETPRDRIIRELLLWREFARRRVKRGKAIREFRSDILPDEVRALISDALSKAKTVADVARIFDEAIQDVKEVFDAEV